MTKEEILEEQVEALEKLLKLKQAIIEDLEKKIEKLDNNGWQPYAPFGVGPGVNLPNVIWADPCPKGGNHEYPNMWGGIQNPPCIKCGQTIPNPFGTAGGLAGSDSTLK